MPAEPPSHTALVRRARRINRELALLYPDAGPTSTSPRHWNCWSRRSCPRRCTDKRVNLVTPVLFARYRTAADYAAADREDVEKIIQSTGFFRAKTTSILGLGQALCERFGGEVPGRLRDLVTLPGVGRKTANVVLGNAFGVPGITVDTHFGRLARRFGWTPRTTRSRSSRRWGRSSRGPNGPPLSHRLIAHGRRVCHSRRPACGACGIARSARPTARAHGRGNRPQAGENRAVLVTELRVAPRREAPPVTRPAG